MTYDSKIGFAMKYIVKYYNLSISKSKLYEYSGC